MPDGDVDLESVGSLLDDEEEDNVGYGQIIVSMTRNSRRERRDRRAEGRADSRAGAGQPRLAWSPRRPR